MKIGVLGAGHLGKIHIKCLKSTSFDLSGFYDADSANAAIVSEELDIKAFGSVDELIRSVDAVDIVTPTSTHYELAKKCLEAGKHVFIEKPVTNSTQEAKELYQLQQDSQLIVQVGHVERYNPAILALKERKLQPSFIEGHRLSTFNPRGTDVSVVLDLMIHDLDLVLNIVSSPVSSVLANGVNIVSNTADICNTRIQFENGCVANLTASRISLKQMRKLRLFQSDAYISMDFLKKTSQVVKLDNVEGDSEADINTAMILDTAKGPKRLSIDMPDMVENNAIQSELDDFYKSIVHGSPVTVPLKDGYLALELAHQIEAQLASI